MDLNHSHHEKPLLFIIVIAICLVAVIFYLSSSYGQQSQAGWPESFGGLSYSAPIHSGVAGAPSYFTRGPVPTFTGVISGGSGMPSYFTSDPMGTNWAIPTNIGSSMPTDWAASYFADYTRGITNPMGNMPSGWGNSSTRTLHSELSFGGCNSYETSKDVFVCDYKESSCAGGACGFRCGPTTGRGQCFERYSSCSSIAGSNIGRCTLSQTQYPKVGVVAYIEDDSGSGCSINNGKCSKTGEDLDKACALKTRKSDCVGSCFWQGSLFNGQCLSNNGGAVHSCLGLDSNSCSNQGKEYCEAKNAYCGTNGNENDCASFFVEGWTSQDRCYIDSEGACISKKDSNGFNLSCDRNPATTIQNCNASLTEDSCNSDISIENGCAWKNEFKCVPKKNNNTDK